MVGAGIAGAGAAWALRRAGREVDVFEAAPVVGGNARTHAWGDGDAARVAGLAVLAWPAAYFRNYERLLDTLGIATEDVRLRFFVQKGAAWFAHGEPSPLAARHARDLARWRRLVGFVRAIGLRFGPPGPPSFYRVSYANPLTYAPAWALARAFGVSRAFWDDVVVALYSSSFLTTRLDGLPAVILPTLDDIVSVEDGGRMRSWRGHSGEVFDALLGSGAGRVHTDRAIVRVRGDEAGVTIADARGDEHRYDAVILAGSAGRMAEALDAGAHAGVRRLLAGVRYVEARDDSFTEGHAHGDASVLPAAHREKILSTYCTFIDVVERAGARRYENHFVVSAWAPAARGARTPMLVAYGKPPERRLAGPVHRFSNRGAHPELSIGNLLAARRLRRWQGHRGLYFCGSYATPGNGHDLSLLSGFVVADALGAAYPFPADAGAAEDFALLRAMMRG